MSTSDPSLSASAKGAWVAGTTVFAGVMLSMLGTFQLLMGLAAVFEDEIFIRGLEYAYAVDITVWGWTHMLLGLIAIAVGIGIVANRTVANVAGIVIAFLSALSSFAFLPYYPLWSLVIIGFDALVIWALCLQVGRARS